MYDFLISPFEYEYMQVALLVGIIVAVACALLSCLLNQLGWSLIGDGVSHAVLPGVVLAYILGVPFVAGALVFALLAVGGFAAAKSRPMSDSFTIPGIASLEAADLQKELFPQSVAPDKQVNGQVVLQAPAGHRLDEEP